MHNEASMGRRAFVAAAGVSALAVSIAAQVPQAHADEAADQGWDAEYDVVEAGRRPRQRVVDHHVDQLEVVARRDLGHHAAERVVHPLGGHDVGEHLPRGRPDRGDPLVTR